MTTEQLLFQVKIGETDRGRKSWEVSLNNRFRHQLGRPRAPQTTKGKYMSVTVLQWKKVFLSPERDI